MSLADRKEREKIKLKSKILDAAKKILLVQGERGLSIRKIAGMIEYSPATIYLYFKDKDAIMHELMNTGFTILTNALTQESSEANPVIRLRKLGLAYIHFGIKNKDWYNIMFNSEKPMQHIEKCSVEWDQGMRLFEYIRLTCREAVDACHIPDMDDELLALHLWSSVHGLVNLALTDRL